MIFLYKGKAYFTDVACEVKNTLFKQYCTTFYGSHLCTFLIEKLKMC